ncbi:MAG: response regulator [Rhodoferax sp.]|nr:response regulator [Rhodoferax sp.]
MGNAFKFTETGRIDLQVDLVETSQQDRACSQPDKVYLRFSVRDTGIGLTPEQVTRMFRSFEQADSSTTRKYGGTGLGLAICKRLVEMMGGEIGVNSVAGAGSEFWFTACLGVAQARKIEVPAIPASVKASTPADSPASSPLTPQTRVLLVEDNPVNRMVMSGMLKRLGGGEPVIACDGQEAVDIALRESFDVILMDSQMPVMDGLEATRRLRAAGLTTPIIGVSAGALGEERQAALDAGASDYVLKPVNLGTLGPALARALGGS